ncbi:MAG TPA: aminoglycoside 6'-N-acetyltransferase [Thermoanaerobaculia bacterium]|nr:aminoglycoside 6'-N-acetyltransferase [Thermoanaerobaculia bacterium]
MRLALWPEGGEAEHLAEMEAFLEEPERYAQFIAVAESGAALGFVEASLRTDYVNGTESSPVAFLEGLYVEPTARRQGTARALVQAVVAWAKSRGCSELASDTQLENVESQAMHARLGFVETERVVYFNMALGSD